MKIFYFKEGKQMLSKKKKIFILISMVVLLVVTGYLNVALNKTDSELQTATTSANFFTSFREDKLATRNYQIEIYKSIIATSADPVEVDAAKQKQSEIASVMAQENNLEGLIRVSGYEDAIVTISENDGYNVFVKTSAGITSSEIDKILAIITMETGTSATNVKIIGVE